MFYLSSVSSKSTNQPLSAGFSLVELLVSIGIVTLVLSIVVTRQDAFNSSILLRSQTYEIALAMREVQLGTISATSDGSGDFRGSYGVHFDTANAQQYRVFRDVNGDNFWDSGEDIGFSGFLDKRFEIKSTSVGSDVSIVFKRPNFDALFYTESTPSGVSTSDSSVTLTVGFVGSSGSVCGVDVREIVVSSSGQIAVVECP